MTNAFHKKAWISRLSLGSSIVAGENILQRADYESYLLEDSEHIQHIFEEGELQEDSTVRNFRTVQMEGSREVSR